MLADGLTAEEQGELRRLRREGKRLREERGILKAVGRDATSCGGPETPFRGLPLPRLEWPSQLDSAFEPVKEAWSGVAAEWRVVTPAGDPSWGSSNAAACVAMRFVE